jgi:3-dehydroquinate synthase
LKNIVFTNQVATDLEIFIQTKQYSKVAVLTDENTYLYCYPRLLSFLSYPYSIQIQSGEAHKNLQTCEVIWRKMTDFQMDRKSLLINLGGGVIGDMGGFCAATYKRGIDFVQIPTTLLSMVDASVGGKLGIDFQGLKNHIGVFQEPALVLIDTHFLATLAPEELRSGFAEVIKHCLIADEQKWHQLLKNPTLKADLDLVKHSVAIKSKIVEEDPLEKGLRKVLNFGHTIGHAIESLYLPTSSKLLHGEAIAIGMICESFISLKRNLISQEDLDEITAFVKKIYPDLPIFEKDFESIIQLTLQDKKNEHQQIQCTLLARIGKAIFNQTISPAEIHESLYFYIQHGEDAT